VAVATRLTWCLLEGVVSLDEIGLTEVLEGACRLPACGFRQAVWNQFSPGDASEASGGSRCRIGL